MATAYLARVSKFQTAVLGVIALATSAVAVKAFLPTPTVQSPGQQWEYMELQVNADYDLPALAGLDASWTGSSAARANKHYTFNTAQLTTLGKEGWEVVGVAAAAETVHYNFGNNQYVAGLQPNVRAGSATVLLKRPYREPETEELQGPPAEPAPGSGQ